SPANRTWREYAPADPQTHRHEHDRRFCAGLCTCGHGAGASAPSARGARTHSNILLRRPWPGLDRTPDAADQMDGKTGPRDVTVFLSLLVKRHPGRGFAA